MQLALTLVLLVVSDFTPTNTKNKKVGKIVHLGNAFSLLKYSFSLIFNKYVLSDKRTGNAFSLMHVTSASNEQTELLS